MLRLGGKFGGVSFVKPWHDYFPHFGAADLRANLHQQLDALQGQRRTLMVGEVFNLPLVSECVDFARYIIRRHMNVEAPGRSTIPGASDWPSRSVARRLLRTIGRRRRHFGVTRCDAASTRSQRGHRLVRGTVRLGIDGKAGGDSYRGAEVRGCGGVGFQCPAWRAGRAVGRKVGLPLPSQESK